MIARFLFLNCLCAVLCTSALADSPRFTYRLESNAVFAAPEGGSAVAPLVPDEWEDRYLHEFRLYLQGRAEDNVGYRVEPRFFYTYLNDTTEEFDWVLDQAYGYLDLSSSYTFLAGKQRVRWGTGLTFTPTDRWQAVPNPLDPARYLEGTYLFRFDAYWPLVTFTAVYAPSRPTLEHNYERREVVGARLFKLVGTVDLFASVTHDMQHETNFGGAFSWDSGPAVIYGEAAYLDLKTNTLKHLIENHLGDEGRFGRVVLGASRQFSSEATGYLEVYHNGWGLHRGGIEDLLKVMRGIARLPDISVIPDDQELLEEYATLATPARSLSRWYIAANGSYIYLDTWSVAGNAIVEPVNDTLYLYPLFSYVGFQSVDLTLGAYSVLGSDDSEAALIPSHFALDFRFIVHF